MPPDPQPNPRPNDQQPVSDTPDTGMHTERLIRSLNSPDHTRAYFTEMVSRQSPRFHALSPVKRGTPYDYGHAGDLAIQAQFPNLRFLKEITPSRGGEIPGMVQEEYVIWLWGTDGDAEDTFNAEVTYLAESTAHPIYARTSTIRREVYEANPTVNVSTPLTALVAIKVTAPGTGYNTATVGITGGSGSGATAEAVLNNAGAIDHIVVTNEGSGYTSAPTITITGDGTGATALGIIQPQSAVLVSQKKSELPEGDPQGHEYVSVLRVYSTLPGPPLITQSIGQDNLIPAKYRRLVTHIVTEQDVAASYSIPGSLSGNQTQVELAMKTIAEARLKIIEEIINSISSLTGHELGEYGTLTIVESIVDDGTAIDSGFLVITSKVDPLGNGKSIKITASVASYPTLHGQNYDEALDVVIPYSQDTVTAGTTGNAHSEITPMDSRRSRKKTYDPTAVASALDAYSLTIPDTTSLDLPDVLLSVTGILSSNSGDGTGSVAGASGATGPHGSYSLSAPNHSQASATSTIELQTQIKHYWARNIPTIRYMFFLPAPVSAAQVLTKLATLAGATVNAWPKFQPVTHDFVSLGQRLTAQIVADTSVNFSYYSDGYSFGKTEGDSHSKDHGVTSQTIRISPTIHGSLNVGGVTTHTESVTVTAESVITGTVGASSTPSSITLDAVSSVAPTSLGATGGVSIMPTSGLYLVSSQAQPYRYGYVLIHAEVVDFANVT